MSSNDHSPPQLTTSNYNDWSIEMMHFLNRHGVGVIITELWTAPDPPTEGGKASSEDRKELLQFRIAQSKAAGFIYAAVPADQRVHLHGVSSDDAIGMWNKLKDTYVKQNSTTRFIALDSLLKVQQKERESLGDLAARTTRLHTEVKQLLPDDYTLEKLLDDLEVNALLNGMSCDKTKSFGLKLSYPQMPCLRTGYFATKLS